MSHIRYDGSGELHVTAIGEAQTMDKTDFDRVITVCQDSIEDNVSSEQEYSHYNMADGPACGYGGDHSYEMFEEAADELYEALSSGETVLIHCHAGESRSVSVATAALGRLLDESRSNALALVHRYRITSHDPDGLLLGHVDDYISKHTDHGSPFEHYEDAS